MSTQVERTIKSIEEEIENNNTVIENVTRVTNVFANFIEIWNKNLIVEELAHLNIEKYMIETGQNIDDIVNMACQVEKIYGKDVLKIIRYMIETGQNIDDLLNTISKQEKIRNLFANFIDQ